jgi:integrase
LRAFLAHDPADRLQPLWTLAATTGARRGELCGLAWRSVDLDAARLTITRTFVNVAGKPRFSEPKTDSGRRTITLDPATVAALRAWRAAQLAERLALGLGRADGGALVFTAIDGAPLHPRSVSDAFRQRARRAGLPDLSFHGLRHSYAVAALDAGESYKTVQQRLGHSSPAITLGVYGHVTDETEEASASRIARSILGEG